MKKLYLFACAVLAGIFASCSNDPGAGLPAGEEVVYTVGVTSGSRYDMDKGGLGNVNPEEYSVRYILEAYSSTGGLAGRYERFGDVGATAGTTFKFGLVAQPYTIVVWADFVPKTDVSGAELDVQVAAADATDLYYDTKNGLKNISLIGGEQYGAAAEAANGGRMVRDAYFGSVAVDLRNGVAQANIELKRPFMRVELYSETDLAQSASNPKSVSVTYPAGQLYTAFDALAGDVVTDAKNDAAVSYIDNITESFADGSQLVTFDYVFAPAADGQISLQAKFFAEEDGDGTASEWMVNAIHKQLKRNYILEISGDLAEGFTNIDALIEAAADGGTIELPAGDYQTTLDFSKSVTISGPAIAPGEEPVVKIYSNKINTMGQLTPSTDPSSPDYRGGVQGWEGRYPLILIDATGAAETVEVVFENVTISTKDVPYDVYWGTDGVSVYGNAKVTFNNVVFEDFIRPELDLVDQYGRCITVGSGAEVVATGCTFRKFNKNAVDVLPGGKATLTECKVYGEGYTTEEAVGKKAAQNGFVFRYDATGQVSNCEFYNLTYDKGNLNANSVLLYNITAESNVTKGTDGTENNAYTNCDVEDWTVVLFQEP